MSLSKADRAKVRDKFGGKCAYCGEPLQDRWHADHVERVERVLEFDRERGGVRCTDKFHRPENDTVENRWPSCAPCNLDKHSMTLDQWRRKLQNACDVLRRNQPTYRHALRFGLVQETGRQVTFYFERVGVPLPKAGAA